MNLLTLSIAGALGVTATVPMKLNAAPRNIAVQGNFTYGSGGTTVNAYLQTTLDGGVTWIDIANFSFAVASARAVFNLNSQTPIIAPVTPTDGALGANTGKDGILGAQFRVKYVTTGTYVGTTLSIDVSTDQVS